MSEWVVHFTKGTSDEAKRTLAKILSEKTLRAFSEDYICFSEAPLEELNKLFQIYRSYKAPRFAPYGVAVSKSWLFDQGGRHVIYGPETKQMVKKWPEQLRFRHVGYKPPDYDFTWQREWRIPTKSLAIDPGSTLVIVPTEDDEVGLTCDAGVDYEYEGPDEVGFYPYFIRGWYTLSLDHVARHESHPDDLIAQCKVEQKLSETEE